MPAGALRVSYWVITPEVGTDDVVAAIRKSWLRGVGSDAHFCVASTPSTSSDSTLHWLRGVNRSHLVAAGRADLNRRIKGGRRKGTGASASGSREGGPGQRELTRLYNNFLRHKVFEIMRHGTTSP